MPSLAIQSYTFQTGVGSDRWLFTIEYSAQTDRMTIKDVKPPRPMLANAMPEKVLRDMVVAADAVRAGTVEDLTGSSPTGTTGFVVL